MTDTEWVPVLQAILPICGVVLTGVLSRYLPRGIKAFEQISGVQLDAQQQAAVYAAAQTSANILISHVEQGLVPLSAATDSTHPVVTSHAANAIARVPVAVGEQSVTTEGMSQIIAGKVAGASSFMAAPPPTPPVLTEMPPPPMGGRPNGGPGVGALTDPVSTAPWRGTS